MKVSQGRLPHIHKRNVVLIQRDKGNRRSIDRIPRKTEDWQVTVVLIEDKILSIGSRLSPQTGHSLTSCQTYGSTRPSHMLERCLGFGRKRLCHISPLHAL